MRIAFVAWAVAQAALVTAAADAQCNADNCARAVTGTGIGPTSSRRAACSSFQRCTVTPAPTTVTSTATITPPPVTQTDVSVATDVVPTTETTLLTFQKRDGRVSLHADLAAAAASHAKRLATATTTPAPVTTAVTVCPTALPPYARATCQLPSRYASACSCWGVTRTTTTVPTPTRTVTTTITAPTPTLTAFLTVTTTVLSVVPEPTIANFVIKAGTGQYVGIINEGGLDELVLQADSGAAQHFRLEKTTVYSKNRTQIVDADGGTDQTFIYLDELSVYDGNDFPALICTVGAYDVTNAGYPLSCKGPNRNYLLTESGRNNLALATDIPPGFGSAPQLYAVKP